MVERSLYASVEGTIRAKQAIARKHWTQQILAEEVGLKTRQPIGRFLAGKRVDRRIFMEICFQLDLEWQEIVAQRETATPKPLELPQDKGFDIDALVQQVRSQYQNKLQTQCSNLQILDVSVPIDVADIYINVNILEKIPSRQWLEISDWLQGFNVDEDQDKCDRLGLAQIQQEQVPGLETVAKYPKLIVLGKPGTGKTTFLKFIALECNQGKFQPHRLPVFFWLKYFVEDARDSGVQGYLSLQDYIYQELGSCGVSAEDVKTLLEYGRLMILLDGLDEVPESQSEEVVKQIRQLSHKYDKNQFAIASRISPHPYYFQGFTEVEIAEFSSTQIAAFAKKYFVAMCRNDPEQGLIKASQFIEQLGRQENRPIRELAVTPLLLALTCLVFQTKAQFPCNRAKLYQEALDILLFKWDRTKCVKRDEANRRLSLAQKIKLLNQLAAIMFEQGDYFLRQSQIQQLIADYLRLLPDGETDPMALQLDSEIVLKSIELQHGLLVERSRRIYSFSHLTFQEYFTARYITAQAASEAENRNVVRAAEYSPDSPKLANLQLSSLQQLVNHITEKRWREVFLLTTGMLPQPEGLLWLMKQQIDHLITSDEKLQQFLKWIHQKSQSVSVESKPAAVRAFYFSLALALDHYFTSALHLGSLRQPFPPLSYFPLPLYLSLPLAIEPNLTLGRNFTFNFKVQNPDLPHELGLSRVHLLDEIIKCALEFDLALAPESAQQLQQLLQTLNAQLPSSKKDPQRVNRWWQKKGQAWIEQFIAVILTQQHSGHHWQLSNQQKRSLFSYHYANKLLVDCLHSDRPVTAACREEIEETLLLPG